MSLSLTVSLALEQFPAAIKALHDAGVLNGLQATAAGGQIPPPPRAAAPAMPPMPAQAAPPPPAPPAAPVAVAANPRLEEVLKLMDAYSRAGHQVAGARKVLAVLGLSRAQDANEEQLVWLAQAFANTAWAP